MERNRPHEIDDRAMAIFCNLKPVDLVVSELHPDYAKDYLVEICHQRQMTGEQAHVQLKGKESLIPSKCGTYFSFPLERKHAVYYADKVKLPVFLVLVNVTTGTAYWLFLQRYLHVDLRGKRWRHKRTVTVHVPAANILGSGPGFLDAIKEARTYMAAHQPAAIKAALMATKTALESLDPRFAISITATERGEHRTVSPKEPVDITVGFAGDADETAKKIDDLFGRGLPIDIAPGEVTITGSPLFEEIFKHGGTLHANRKIDATAVLIARDANDAPVARLDGLQATVHGGPNEMRIETSLPDAPLLLRNTWTPETTKATVSFNINCDRWHSQPVLHLAYFDQLSSFAEAAKGCASMRLEISYRGNFCLGGTFQLNNHTMPDEMYGYLRFVRARDIAKHFSINPPLPAELILPRSGGVEDVRRTLPPAYPALVRRTRPVPAQLGRGGQ